MREGIWKASAFAVAAAVWAATVGAFTPASAQGFLQQLFGLGSPAQPSPSVPSVATPGGSRYSLPGPPSSSFISRRISNDDGDNEPRSSGIFRTVCVRQCDGYFFPISNNVSKRGLYRDGMRCQAQCGEDARVFYLPAKTMEVDNAVDLNGRVYSHMRTAFMYRKTLIAGCKCKPDPWAASELARHQKYADVALEQKLAGLAKGDAPQAVAGEGDEKDEPTEATSEAIARVAHHRIADGDVAAATTVALPPLKLKSNVWQTSTRLAAPAARAKTQPARLQQAQAKPTVYNGSMGLGGSQLIWPGDAPPRRQ